MKRIASGRISGVLYGVEGIFEGGFSVSARVSEEEAGRLFMDPDLEIPYELELPDIDWDVPNSNF